MNLSAVLEQQISLPSIPRVVALLLHELRQTEVELHKVNQLISTDPALTTRLLQLANTSFFGQSGTIGTVSEALALLDLGHVLKMAEAAAAVASPKAVAGVRLSQFWEYSLNVARVSRSLATLVRLNPQTAFTTGLIHAVGELAMHLAMPQRLEQLDREVPLLALNRAHAERKLLGYCYGAVGAGYARMWRFPPAMVNAIEHQYAPFDNHVYEPLAGVVHLATWRARCKEARLSERGLAVTFPDAVGVAMGLNIDTVLQQDPFDWGAHT
jgi:HD-like signal output (HDOD) protein